MSDVDLSVSIDFDAVCPVCGNAFIGKQLQIVDVDRRPELATRVCDGSAQRSYCPRCIGPGIERTAAMAVVRRAGTSLEYLLLSPRADGPAMVADIEALAEKLREHCGSHGFPAERIEWQGTSLFNGPADIERAIDRAWSDIRIPLQDPTLYQTILLDLLKAPDAADRARIVLGHPDLARPNMETFLATIAVTRQGRIAADAEAVMAFLASAKRIGVPATVEQWQRKQAQVERAVEVLETLGDEVRSQYLEFHEGEFGTEEEYRRGIALGTKLNIALSGAELRPLRAFTLTRLACLWRDLPGDDQSEGVKYAIQNYNQVLANIDADDGPDNCKILLELSALWDRSTQGDRRNNLECALELAQRAAAYGDRLPRELLAKAWMEVGILYTSRVAGDPVSNATLAREALLKAKSLASRPGLKLLVQYNEALTYIEEADAGRAGNRLDFGIQLLQLLAQPLNAAQFSDEQRQNLYQSLGAALAKRATGARGTAADFDSAAKYVEEAISLAKEGKRAIVAARNQSLLASIHADRLRRGRADIDVAQIVDLIDEAAKTLTIEFAPFEFAHNEMRRAYILSDLLEPGSFDEWITDAYEAACKIFTPQSTPHLCRRVRYQLAKHYLGIGELPAAAKSLTIACEAAEAALVATDTASQRAQELEPNAELYELYVDTLQRVASQADASPDARWQVLEAMERGRARLYLDRMGLRELPQFAGIPRELIERERGLLAALDAWGRSGAVAAPVFGGMDANKLRAQQDLRHELQALWNEIAATGEGGRLHVAFRRRQPPDRETLEKLAGQMGSSCATLSFFVLRDRILATLSRDGEPPHTESLPVDAQRLQSEFIDPFVADVVERMSAAPTGSTREHRWCALGEELFGPFSRSLAGIELLILVPHGPLHALPLHALTLAGRPLIDQVAVAYAPSLGVLRSLLDAECQDGKSGQALVMSHAVTPDEAASFEGEADQVAQLRGTLARHHATRSAVIENAPNASFIHLACHGYFDAADPLSSGVELADGTLAARDWLTLKLSARLATLSACETGVLQVRRGDELQGMGRTLIEAGAASALLTLWRVVSDSTADWMKCFYRELDRTPSSRWTLAGAFRAATLESYRRDPDPLLWAPFVLIGDPR